MLLLRAIFFTVLVPGAIAGLVPLEIRGSHSLAGGVWNAGWFLVVLGASIYLLCLLRFLAEKGTPAIFFARPLRFLIGEEPNRLVRGGLYRYSRNPMYIAVLFTVFGQAVVFGSTAIAVYGLCLFGCFHLIVVTVEEPHLRKREGPAFGEYSRQTPRWVKLW